MFALGGLYADLEEAFDVSVDLIVSDSIDDEFRRVIEAEEVQILDTTKKT